MTDYPTPKFPVFSTPEEIKAASEKVVNFWVGALSPMWVPFWAASSFGLSAWAMTQSLSKNEGLLKDAPQMPDLAKWPDFGSMGFGSMGFGNIWAAEKAADAVSPLTETAKTAVKSTSKAAKTTADKAADIAVDTANTAVASAADAVEQSAGMVTEAITTAPEPQIAFDPVIEAPVAIPVAISGASVEAPAVLKASAKPAVEPKPIARSVSAVKKPKKS